MAGLGVLTTWTPIKVRYVIRYKWTDESSVSVINGHLQTVYSEGTVFHRMVALGIACSMKKGRMLRMKVKVGVSPHQQLKVTLLENRTWS
ncbi:hypothetical protein TNCV_5096221 [Trichonephila clavipes]|nr:hypothetical protein TNCV_5096221 [Trichonephila clavipes]